MLNAEDDASDFVLTTLRKTPDRPTASEATEAVSTRGQSKEALHRQSLEQQNGQNLQVFSEEALNVTRSAKI